LGFFCLPNFPNNSPNFFNKEQSQMAQYRMFVSAGGVVEDDEGDYWGGFWMACKDPFIWAFAALHFAIIIAQSFKDFFPSVRRSITMLLASELTTSKILATLGSNETTTYLVQAPPYVVAYIVTLIISWSSGRFLEHCYHIIGPMAAALIGVVIMISTLSTGARYFSLVLLCSGPFVALNVRRRAQR
jgi:hypothetical protein